MKEDSANNPAKTRYSLSSYYNEHEDQGMRECVCGEIIRNGSFEEMIEEFSRELIYFCKDFDTTKGTLSVNHSEEGNIIFVDWKDDDNDRCFGLEIKEL